MKSELFFTIVQLFKEPASGAELDERRWESIVFILRQTQLLATLYQLARVNGDFEHYPPYARKHLKAASVYAQRQAQQVRFECLEISNTLKEKEIVPVFLKGAGYTLSGSQNGQGRVYSDIDVLVPEPVLGMAQQLLQKNGWFAKKLNDYDERYYREWAHEIPPMSNVYRGTTIDVHHNIIPPVSGRAPDPGIFFNEVVFNEQGLAYLSPPAATLHSCIHLFTNEDFTNGFRDMVDLYLLIQQYRNDQYWGQLVKLAEQTGFTLELFYCLEALQQIFALRVSDPAVDKLNKRHNNIKTRLLSHWLFKSALCPHHPLIFSLKNQLASFLVYLRGHWIKMPWYILLTHLSVKSFFITRDFLFGKHQFDKE